MSQKPLCGLILIMLILGTTSTQALSIEGDLLNAIEKGDAEEVEELIENGADVNARTVNGIPALIFAAMKGHAEIVKILIENGADVNGKTTYGMTALMYAAQIGHTEIKPVDTKTYIP